VTHAHDRQCTVFLICLLYSLRPYVIVCFELFHCEIHGMVPLLQINVTFLSFTEMGMGMGTVVSMMDGDGDDLETRCGDRVGMGIRVPGTVRDGYKYMSPCSSVVHGK